MRHCRLGTSHVWFIPCAGVLFGQSFLIGVARRWILSLFCSQPNRFDVVVLQPCIFLWRYFGGAALKFIAGHRKLKLPLWEVPLKRVVDDVVSVSLRPQADRFQRALQYCGLSSPSTCSQARVKGWQRGKEAAEADSFEQTAILCYKPNRNTISGTAGGRKFRKKKIIAYRNEALVVWCDASLWKFLNAFDWLHNQPNWQINWLTD